MKKMIRETAEEILQEYTNCYSEVDEDCLVKMLEKLASDVAREIFAEIEETVRFYLPVIKTANWQLGLKIAIAELKKKYTGGEG